jgi:hypothetical protein
MSAMPEENAHRVMIPEPEAGRILHFTMQPAGVYLLGFAPEKSTIEQDGQDVRVLCENGGRIFLHGFFPAVSQEDITLELGDGTLISGRDLAEVLAMSPKDFRTDSQSDLTVASVDAAALVVEKNPPPAGHLRMEDVLDTSPPVPFGDLPLKAAPGGHDSAADSGAVFAINSVSSPAGPITPDEPFESVLLALQRMDM